eukprot:TRINITY_DN70_c1_g1_i1.p1 TRINITY_DN70_c1_g1~~TRINITY_DN70_c1_g1_i1.p1  ORF type:complete len:101 (+),score=11.81 TRINITY_DN70_c1_g1_i1:238-540(+)
MMRMIKIRMMIMVREDEEEDDVPTTGFPPPPRLSRDLVFWVEFGGKPHRKEGRNNEILHTVSFTASSSSLCVYVFSPVRRCCWCLFSGFCFHTARLLYLL